MIEWSVGRLKFRKCAIITLLILYTLCEKLSFHVGIKKLCWQDDVLEIFLKKNFNWKQIKIKIVTQGLIEKSIESKEKSQKKWNKCLLQHSTWYSMIKFWPIVKYSVICDNSNHLFYFPRSDILHFRRYFWVEKLT